MAVLVTLLGVVVALLALLVAGLLRSHAEILRALHELGVDMDPASADRAVTATSPVVHRSTVPKRPSRRGNDLVGVSPELDAVTIAVTGVDRLTLLAFLTSGCGTCLNFWDVFRDGGPLEIPGGARLVCVTKDPSDESVASIRRVAPTTIPVVMSTAAWESYDAPVAPFFVLVEGASGSVVGEGAASEWAQVVSLLQNALDDAGLLDRKGNVKRGARTRANADGLREARADRDLLAAGILPGDPSLYVLADADAHSDAAGAPGDPE